MTQTDNAIFKVALDLVYPVHNVVRKGYIFNPHVIMGEPSNPRDSIAKLYPTREHAMKAAIEWLTDCYHAGDDTVSEHVNDALDSL